MTDDRYLDIGDRDHPLYSSASRCSACRAIVLDIDTASHTRWHGTLAVLDQPGGD